MDDERRVEQAELDAAERLTGEHLTVWRHRYRAARTVGFTEIDAEVEARIHNNGGNTDGGT